MVWGLGRIRATCGPCSPHFGDAHMWPCGHPSFSFKPGVGAGLDSSLEAGRPRAGEREGWCLLAGVAWGLTDCPLSQAPRVCRAGADPGGPPPAVCASLQPGGARVEARLWAAGVVRRPRAEVCGSVWEWGLCSHHERRRQPGRGSVLVSGPPGPPPEAPHLRSWPLPLPRL